MSPITRITKLEGQDILLFGDAADWRGSANLVGDMDIDADGVGPDGKPNNIYGDPYYQSDTSLHYNGKPLNSQVDKYIVLPPAAINGVKGIVLGCQAMVVDLRTGKWTQAVVGDIGPSKKIGEASCACASAIGISPNANTGGCETQDIVYVFWPGRPATVDGKTYTLQPMH